MVQSIRDKTQACQTELLQDFFVTQMKKAYSASWIDEVKKVANDKQDSSHAVYKDIKKKFDEKDEKKDTITINDFDVTALGALIRFDFKSVCCQNNRVRGFVGLISDDRNAFSHIANFNDTENMLAVAKTSVVNMKKFLDYLEQIEWYEPVVRGKYFGTGHNDGKFAELDSLIAQEQNDESASKANIRQYLQTLQMTREEREGQYVSLSYNREAKSDDKKFLDELIETNINNTRDGMRIVAAGGYGKSWTLSEIAGRYAQAYLKKDEEKDEEKEKKKDMPIPVLIEMGKLYDGCSTISQKIAELFFDRDEKKVFDFYKKNKIVLLIDAMDEAKVEIQDNISREIASIYEAPQLYSNITFVCASRKSCIDKYPVTIPCYAIRELDDDQIAEFMKNAIPEDLIEKAKQDWTGDNRKEFLSRNRTPFYINCYVELICETGDNDFVDTTQLMKKFLEAMIDREIKKRGFHSDKATFINFLKEFCRLLDLGNEDGERVAALPENDVINELEKIINVEEGQASIKKVCRKLVEIQILARDDEEMLLSFFHQNYKEYINRQYPAKRYRTRWK